MIKKYLIFFSILFLFWNCSKQDAKPIIVTSSHPIYSILKEIIGVKSELVRLIPPNASPHTFNPNPSDMYKVEAAKAFFYSSEIGEGWANSIHAKNKISLVSLLPKNVLKYFPGKDSIVDSHFWTDPNIVKALLKPLTDTLAKIDPDNATTYRTNAMLFEKRLSLLDTQVEDIIQPIKGKLVFLFHPSFLYFLSRYGLQYGGSVETSPGKEPTPKYLADLIEKIKKSGSKAIFSEPQLPDNSVKTISAEAGVLSYVLDPNGGIPGRETYAELILYNAKTLRDALR